MKKVYFLCGRLRIACLWFTTLVFLIGGPAFSAETNTHIASIQKNAQLILKNHFLLPSSGDPCFVEIFCQGANSEKSLEDIENEQFQFIYPSIWTNSAVSFLAFLKLHTNCKDLSALSTVFLVGLGSTEDISDWQYDFFRPTHGFAVYFLPKPNDQIMLLSGEDYVDSGSQASGRGDLDYDVEPEDLSAYQGDVIDSLHQGALIPVSIQTCLPLGTGFYFQKSVKYSSSGSVYDDASWFVSPIIYGQKVYFLNAWKNYKNPHLPSDFGFYGLNLGTLNPLKQPQIMYLSTHGGLGK